MSEVNMVETRICKTCGSEKELCVDNFYLRTNKKTFRKECNDCKRASMIIYYAENKERIDTSNKIRYEENKYTINLQKKEYAKAHKEETSLYQHQYYMENRDDLLE